MKVEMLLSTTSELASPEGTRPASRPARLTRRHRFMTFCISLFSAAVLCLPFSSARAAEKTEKAEVTTADIAAGIKQHIDEKTKAGGGHFHLKDGDKDLALTLSKIHTDKLTSLNKTKHFACVDMKGEDGNTYDVDFFLKGEPGAMTVTETAVHKVNGKPRYNWKQRKNGTWHKVPITG